MSVRHLDVSKVFVWAPAIAFDGRATTLVRLTAESAVSFLDTGLATKDPVFVLFITWRTAHVLLTAFRNEICTCTPIDPQPTAAHCDFSAQYPYFSCTPHHITF